VTDRQTDRHTETELLSFLLVPSTEGISKEESPTKENGATLTCLTDRQTDKQADRTLTINEVLNKMK
jgi:hypothetical protein